MRTIERINRLLESRRLNKSKYFRHIGISRSSFYTTLNSEHGEMGSKFLKKTLQYFPDDHDYILFGNEIEENKNNVINEPALKYKKRELDKDEIIKSLSKTVESLSNTLEMQQKIINSQLID